VDVGSSLQINSLFKRAFKCGYVKSIVSLEQLLQDYDDNLFHKATYGNHAMRHLCPVLSPVVRIYKLLAMACENICLLATP